MKLESAIVADKFMLDICGMDEFINTEFMSQEEEDVQEEPYQGLLDFTDMDDVVDQENSEKAVDTYDQFVGAEVCIHDE